MFTRTSHRSAGPAASGSTELCVVPAARVKVRWRVTSLILAAQYNNHEIVQMFLSRNHTIETDRLTDWLTDSTMCLQWHPCNRRPVVTTMNLSSLVTSNEVNQSHHWKTSCHFVSMCRLCHQAELWLTQEVTHAPKFPANCLVNLSSSLSDDIMITVL